MWSYHHEHVLREYVSLLLILEHSVNFSKPDDTVRGFLIRIRISGGYLQSHVKTNEVKTKQMGAITAQSAIIYGLEATRNTNLGMHFFAGLKNSKKGFQLSCTARQT